MLLELIATINLYWMLQNIWLGLKLEKLNNIDFLKNEKRDAASKILNSSNFRKITLVNGEVIFWEVEKGKEPEVFTK